MAANKTARLIGVVTAIICLVAAATVYAFSFGKYEKAKVNGNVVTI